VVEKGEILSHEAESYPIEWKGKQYRLSELTVGVKQAFVKWLKPRVLKEARETLDTSEYLTFRQEIMAGAAFWNSSPSVVVATAFYSTEEGAAKLTRLLMGVTEAELSDAELYELIETKNEDIASDYRLAMDMIWENADPKARKGSAATLAPKDSTDSSATSKASSSVSHETTVCG
jgi:hypothetical protein